jgi:hypothetical protein
MCLPLGLARLHLEILATAKLAGGLFLLMDIRNHDL